MTELNKLTELDQIFAGYSIVLPHAKEMLDHCVQEAADAIARRIFNKDKKSLSLDFEKDLNEGHVFKLKNGILPSKALDTFSRSHYADKVRQSLIHHLALRSFLFSSSEGDSRFDAMFKQMVLSDNEGCRDVLDLFLDKTGKIDYAKAVFAKTLPRGSFNRLIEKVRKGNVSEPEPFKEFRFGTEPGGPCDKFITTREEQIPFQNRADVDMLCSSGRSGSSMLTTALFYAEAKGGRTLLRSHLLPPDPGFKGKILYIYSNPDLAAESALHLSNVDAYFGLFHFIHMESADRQWYYDLKDTTLQTDEKNLLAYDGLGCEGQLESWLHSKTTSCDKQEAQILAIKYENLWESKEEIEEFLEFKFGLPPKRQRGCQLDEISAKEQRFRRKFNLGTPENPRYKAYDKAREIWQKAPPLKYLKIKGGA